MKKNSSGKHGNGEKGLGYIVGFAVLAAVLIVFVKFVSDSVEDYRTGDTSIFAPVVDTTETTEAPVTEITAADTEEAKQTEVTKAHESPKKLEGAEMASEVDGIGVTLNHKTAKTYKIDLNKLAEPGDIIDSFTFYYHAADGETYLGDVKGGFGISVDNRCELKTNNIWYQTPDDFSEYTDGSYGCVKWEIPDGIKEYITVPAGSVLFGFWWNDNTESIVLDRVVCHRKTIREVPVEDVRTVPVNKVLNTDSENTLQIPVLDLIEEGQEIACAEITLEASEPVGEIYARFGMDTLALGNGHYSGKTVIVSSDENTVKVKWVLSDVVKRGAKNSGNFEFILEKCSLPEITVKDIAVSYAYR